MLIFGDRRFSYVAQAGPTRQLPKCWDSRYVPPYLASHFQKIAVKELAVQPLRPELQVS